MPKFSKVVFHPFLFCLYPIIALLAFNISETLLSDALRAVILSVIVTIWVFLIVQVLIKDRAKSGVVTTMFVVLFFSYGHIYALLKDVDFLGLNIGRHRLLGPLWGIFFLSIIWWTIRKLQNSANVTSTLNLVSIIVLVFPSIQILTFQIKYLDTQSQNDQMILDFQANISIDDQTLPDIYYIILDAYSRDDFLMDSFQFDNTDFLDSLTEMGFFVAYCSQSNYSQTQLSLPSSLNMNYLESFYNSENDGEIQAGGLIKFIQQSLVRQILENSGYSVIAFETGHPKIELRDADIFISLEDTLPRQSGFSPRLNKLEVVLIRSTALSILPALSPNLTEILLPDLNYPDQAHRNLVLMVLDTLEEIPALAGQKFVFAHIVSPHKPFVFGPNGEFVDPFPGYKTGYPDQIAYINQRIVDLVEIIIQESEVPPIIIIQGDHGADFPPGERMEEARMAILNAFYLPGDGSQSLYNSISPVNTFRVIFNNYFGQNFDLLEDTSYWSSYDDPDNFTIIQDDSEACK